MSGDRGAVWAGDTSLLILLVLEISKCRLRRLLKKKKKKEEEDYRV